MTQCISAVFAVVRCPSIRLAVTLVDCIHTAGLLEISSNFLFSLVVASF